MRAREGYDAFFVFMVVKDGGRSKNSFLYDSLLWRHSFEVNVKKDCAIFLCDFLKQKSMIAV